MAENIVISNPEELEVLKAPFSKDGAEKIHILADFDRTLTKAFVGGKSTPSIISVLRDENYLTPDYAAKAHALYDKYHPIEIDPEISLGKKKEAMREWWTTHVNLLIKSGLNKKDLERVIGSNKIELRKGAVEFINLLNTNKIPLVIMSSSGLGGDIIPMFLKSKNLLSENIYIVSNSYEWDENGNAVSIKEPIIHGMNKDETAIQNFPAYGVIENRKNVILLGDRIGDIGMIEGFNYDNLVKIGFLNEKIAESLAQYKRNYDVLILNDFTMDYVNELLKEIIE